MHFKIFQSTTIEIMKNINNKRAENRAREFRFNKYLFQNIQGEWHLF